MTDTLSPSEVEFLLASPIGPAGGDCEAARHSAHPAETSALRLSHESLKPLRLSHERLAAVSAVGLAKLLRTTVEVKLASLEEIPVGELETLLENPSYCFLAEAAPLTGLLLFEISPTIGVVCVDRLLGGTELYLPPTACRSLSEIEWKVLSRVAVLITDALREAWGETTLEQPRIVRTESNSRMASSALIDERSIVSTFEIALGEVRGAAHLVLSCSSLSPILSQIDASQVGRRATCADSAQPAVDAASGRVPIVVQLASARLTESELRGLAVGDIIVTDNTPADPVQLLVAGVPRFIGHAGQFEGRKAVRAGDAIAAEAGSDNGSTRDDAAGELGADRSADPAV